MTQYYLSLHSRVPGRHLNLRLPVTSAEQNPKISTTRIRPALTTSHNLRRSTCRSYLGFYNDWSGHSAQLKFVF